MVRYIWRDGMIRKMTLVAYSSGDLGFPTAVDFEFFLAFESLLLYRVRANHYLDLVVRFQGQDPRPPEPSARRDPADEPRHHHDR